MTIWLTILGMALATYSTRAVALLALRGELAPWLRRWLDYVPVAVFTALVLPPLLLTSSEPPTLTDRPRAAGGHRWRAGGLAQRQCAADDRRWAGGVLGAALGRNMIRLLSLSRQA